MEALLWTSVFFIAATAIFMLGWAVVTPSSGFSQRVQWLVGRRIKNEPPTDVKERIEHLLDPLSKAIPKSPNSISQVRAWLTQAGYREPQHLHIYYGLRVLAAFSMLVVMSATGVTFSKPVVGIGAAVLMYWLPRFVLKRRIKQRQLAIQLALPDALDLAVICVEAGLGLDQAISRVAGEIRNAHPELAEEFQLVNLEMRAGKSRADALRNLATRTGVDDLRAFVAVLIQTDRFGTSIASALRVHSDALRTERRQRAEERAAKTTVKMVPALVFFVFPAIFIVTMGPAVLALIRDVLPAMEQ